MKLILTADVSNLGAPGDIVEVKDGYGRNYLLPRQLAIPATRGAEKQVAAIRKARQAREIRDLGHAKEVAATLKDLPPIRSCASPRPARRWPTSRWPPPRAPSTDSPGSGRTARRCSCAATSGGRPLRTWPSRSPGVPA